MFKLRAYMTGERAMFYLSPVDSHTGKCPTDSPDRELFLGMKEWPDNTLCPESYKGAHLDEVFWGTDLKSVTWRKSHLPDNQ